MPLLIHAQELFNSGKHADLTIKCAGGKTLEVHKFAVSQNRFFAGACEGNFKEAMTGSIEMMDDSADSINLLVRHLYAFDYPTNQTLAEHIETYSIAEKYDQPDLKEEAKRAFEASVNFKLHEGTGYSNFFDCIEHIYTTTIESDRGLRDIVVRFARQYKGKLFNAKRKEEVLQLFQDCPEFAVDFCSGENAD